MTCATVIESRSQIDAGIPSVLLKKARRLFGSCRIFWTFGASSKNNLGTLARVGLLTKIHADGEHKIIFLKQKRDRQSLWESYPCSRYWGKARRFIHNGLPPPDVPRWLERFDWCVGFKHGWITQESPRSVFCNSKKIDELITLLSHFELDNSNLPFLVLGGTDRRLSSVEESTLELLKLSFSEIFFEGFDVDMAGIDIMPIGLTEFYLRGNESLFLRLAHESPAHERNDRVLAAWGAYWPGLDNSVEDRKLLSEYIDHNPRVADRLTLNTKEWLTSLSRYSFFLCPLGNGVQSPKLIEGLALGCVPVVRRHVAWEKLQSKGVPMIILDDWRELEGLPIRHKYEQFAEQVSLFRQKVSNLEEYWKFSFNRISHH